MERWHKDHPGYNAKKSREWAAKNPDKLKVMLRRYQLKKYGLTYDSYDNLWIEQVGHCPVCRRPLPYGYSADVDHDHDTGRIRGLLHNNCNRGIGHLQHGPEILMNAVVYLS